MSCGTDPSCYLLCTNSKRKRRRLRMWSHVVGDRPLLLLLILLLLILLLLGCFLLRELMALELSMRPHLRSLRCSGARALDPPVLGGATKQYSPGFPCPRLAAIGGVHRGGWATGRGASRRGRAQG